jgi:hypothetical protein
MLYRIKLPEGTKIICLEVNAETLEHTIAKIMAGDYQGYSFND